MSRDLILYAHIGLGIIIAIAFIWVLIEARNRSFRDSKNAGLAGAIAAWLTLIIGGYYYLTFYPPIKTLILAHAWPWAHEILMETKEHWIFILAPFATLLALMMWKAGPQAMKNEEMRKFVMTGSKIIIVITLAIAVMGRLISMAGLS